LCPAFSKVGITLLHEDPSAHKPWTKTIFVAFVVAISCTPWGCINVLFSVVAELEDVDDIKPRSRTMLRHNKPIDFIFFIFML
jgi:hypothetical protein